MASDNRLSAVPIQAHLASIEVVGDLENGSHPGADYFVKVYVDDEKEKVAKSEKKRSVLPPRWEWPEDQKFLLHPSSTIKIVIYRNRLVGKVIVGQHIGKVFELLENDTPLDLGNDTGNEIVSKVKISLSLIQEPEDSFKRLMETVDANVSRLKNSQVPAVVSTLGNALLLTKSIVDAAANAHPILKISWTVMSSVYSAVSKTKDMDGVVEDVAESLRELLGVAKEYSGLPVIEGTTNVIEEVGRMSLKVMSLIDEYTRLFFIRRTLNTQLFDDMKSRITQCQKSCNDLKQKLDTRIGIDTNRQGARTEAVASEIKRNLETIKDDVKAEKIYQWLSAPDSSKNYHEAREKHQAETCSWFLNGRRFHELQEKAGFLWIKGTAGCGKTVLCSSVIEEIIELGEEKASVSYAYFFFDGRDSQKDLQLHDKLIRSLIWQLSHQCGGIPTVLVNLYGHGQQPSTRSLQNTLQSIISGLQTTYIIIDSLDECIEPEKLLPWIDQIVSLSMHNLHMIVVSRPERNIGDVLQLLDPNCVDLATTVNPDITMYLEEQLSQVKNWDIQTRDIIKSTLTERAGGMFRWVALQLMELKKCPNRRSVMSQLDSLPKGLYETYDRILSKIDEQPDHTKTFLRWLCFSVRPMKLTEISETIVVDLNTADGPRYMPDNRYWDVRDVLMKCSGFITESEEEVKLAHFSIKEYLLSEHLRTGGTSLFHLASAELSHALISQTCLAYLLQSDALDLVEKGSTLSIDQSEPFPLADYAAEHWIFHARSSSIDHSERSWTLKLAQKLFMPNIAKFDNWINIWDLDKPRRSLFESNDERTSLGSRLYYASRLAYIKLSAEGHEAIARLLLENGADANAQGGYSYYSTALQAASAGGHEAIARLLFENGADVNAQGEFFGTALQTVSVQVEGCEVLVENRVDVNVQAGFFGNALQAASAGGHDTTARLLLENGADVNAAQGGEYGTALQAASAGGHDTTARLLLENGADVNAAQRGEYGTALQAASAGGHVTIVRLLLKNGAYVNVQAGFFGNALQAASAGGHDTIARLLLENGADVNAAQGGEYGTALQAASAKGYEAIARLLLENGADVNAKGGRYNTTLQAASAGGNEAIVRLLLENGADVNAQGLGGVYGNALQAASAGGHDMIVRLLLENGADVDARGGYLGTALEAASVRGHDTIARLLLENGADVNAAQGKEYDNALQAASAEGHEAIARLLLENGVDVNVQGGFFCTALQAASAEGYETIARLLLENGADVNAQGGRHGTALQAASDRGHQAITELLLENGANITSSFRPINRPLYEDKDEYFHDYVHYKDEDTDSPSDYIDRLVSALQQ
ncbi:ankyrin repeat-containing domain protein [Pholiota molesta]|nr:ankyrin repeat-containing domain protein [Pholiota molesta]